MDRETMPFSVSDRRALSICNGSTSRRSATTNTRVATTDIGNLLQYALDNKIQIFKIQIFELYPAEWLQADSPTSPGFMAANQAK
jgi:hypothetical protein